jgi:hypothetical protein
MVIQAERVDIDRMSSDLQPAPTSFLVFAGGIASPRLGTNFPALVDSISVLTRSF